MRFVGYSEYHHDGNLAIIEEDGTVAYASASERYSGMKNDPLMHHEMWDYVNDDDHITFAYAPYANDEYLIHENYKRRRPSNVTQESRVPIPSHVQCDAWNLHHMSHCSAAMTTRPWTSIDDTVVVSVDGCGEIEATVIKDGKLEHIKHLLFPQSLGEIYSKITQGLGYLPIRDEYIVMGLSAYGEVNEDHVQYLRDWYHFWQTEEGKNVIGNRVECTPGKFDIVWTDNVGKDAVQGRINGMLLDWTVGQIKTQQSTPEDIAATLQAFFEIELLDLMKEARQYGSKLVYTGGCAQNVVANTKIYDLFDDVYIPTAPHDGGNGLGCASRTWHLQTGGTHLKWSPYSGHNIERELNPKEVALYLVENRVCGVANGKAEYGPRALGNRSLLADVRYDVKDTVNDIKRRQRFRPFAPAILSEFANEYFDGPMSEYMQYAATAKHDYSSVTHVDGSARVQVVKPDCQSKIRQILEEYYELTGVPMLLNTSLNIRNKPMVNTLDDAIEWEKKYKVRVF